jgi:hypothetical protein
MQKKNHRDNRRLGRNKSKKSRKKKKKNAKKILPVNRRRKKSSPSYLGEKKSIFFDLTELTCQQRWRETGQNRDKRGRKPDLACKIFRFFL